MQPNTHKLRQSSMSLSDKASFNQTYSAISIAAFSKDSVLKY